MTKRLSRAERRLQITESALALLGEVPLTKLTTRLVAKQVGISQPALFRHFRSRDDLLAAVVHLAMDSMRERLSVALEEEDPFVSLQSFTHGLFGYVEENPGLPGLLFFDASDDEEVSFHAPLRSLVSSQRTMVAEMVRRAQERGTLSDDIAVERAATLYVSLVQGTLLQWQHGGRVSCLEKQSEELLNFWRAALSQGIPARRHREQPNQPKVTQVLLARLDVRPILQSGRDPLEDILAEIAGLAAGGVLELLAPFRPTPLLTLLKGKGCSLVVEEPNPGLFRVWVRPQNAAPPLDLRDFPAPEPMQQILEGAASLQPGEVLLAVVPRIPRLLLPRLLEHGVLYQVQESLDGIALLAVSRPRESDSIVTSH